MSNIGVISEITKLGGCYCVVIGGKAFFSEDDTIEPVLVGDVVFFDFRYCDCVKVLNYLSKNQRPFNTTHNTKEG